MRAAARSGWSDSRPERLQVAGLDGVRGGHRQQVVGGEDQHGYATYTTGEPYISPSGSAMSSMRSPSGPLK
jgi:hypothetical protein